MHYLIRLVAHFVFLLLRKIRLFTLLYLYFLFLSLLLILFIIYIIYIFTSTSLCRFSYMQSPLFNSALEPSSCTSSLKALVFFTFIYINSVLSYYFIYLLYCNANYMYFDLVLMFFIVFGIINSSFLCFSFLSCAKI